MYMYLSKMKIEILFCFQDGSGEVVERSGRGSSVSSIGSVRDSRAAVVPEVMEEADLGEEEEEEEEGEDIAEEEESEVGAQGKEEDAVFVDVGE